MKDQVKAETSSREPVPRLGLRAAEAAKALGIGQRLLWELTNRREIPHLRLGRAVIYPVDGLQAWLAQRGQTGATPSSRGRKSE